MFTICLLSIPHLVFQCHIISSIISFADNPLHCCKYLRWVIVQSQFSSNNRGIKSTGTSTKSLCILSKAFFTSVDDRKSLCLFVYDLFVKWLILSSILTLRLSVHSKKKDLSTLWWPRWAMPKTFSIWV